MSDPPEIPPRCRDRASPIVGGPRDVPPPSGDDVRRRLEETEQELLALADALDDPVDPTEFTLGVLVLSQRARTLYRGFLALQHTDVPLAARSLVRPMVEINTLIRFLRKDPELHVELWEAEAERHAIAMVDEANQRHIHQWGPMTLQPGAREEKQARVEDARRRARDAGTPGVGRSGAVLPSTVKQLDAIDEPAASEAYTFGYRPASWDVHTSARAFIYGERVERNDGTVSYEEPNDSEDQIGVRALAATTLASTLELAAIVLDLSIEQDARAILVRYVPQMRDARPTEGTAAPSAFPGRQPSL